MTREHAKTTRTITRVKMYKSGKFWVAAAITITSVGIIVTQQGTTAYAATDVSAPPIAAEVDTGNQVVAQTHQLTKTTNDGIEHVAAATSAGTSAPKDADVPSTSGTAATAATKQAVVPDASDSAVTVVPAASVAAKVSPTVAEPEPVVGTPKSAETAAEPLVTTKDAHGDVSVDPTHTGAGDVALDPADMQNYFTAQHADGENLPISDQGTVKLTDGTKPMQLFHYDSGTGFVTAKQQIDFKSDFTLNVTMTSEYDPATMPKSKDKIWLGGDGTALFFEPLPVAKVLDDARAGEYLGLATGTANTLSFNISSNANWNLKGYEKESDSNKWYLFQANDNALNPVSDVYETGITLGTEKGRIAYTFDMKYDAVTRNIVTNVLDEAGTQLTTWDYDIPTAWSTSGDAYTMGVSATIGESKATYTATVNSYSYTPVVGTLAITATGLPDTALAPNQQGIKGMVGNIVAFYPEGTAAPTSDANGQPVTTAIAVPLIDGYTLRQPQFITMDVGNNTAELAYHKPTSLTVRYFADDGTELQPAATITGDVGQTYDLGTTPTFTGYTFDQRVETPATTDGKFVDAPHTIVFHYIKNIPDSAGTTVNYVDENGNALHPSQTFTGKVGTTYQAAVEDIPDFTFVGLSRNSAPRQGLLASGLQTVNFVYRKNPVAGGTVTVQFVDSAGNTIRPAATLSGNVDDSYAAAPAEIAGYTYQGLALTSGPKRGLIVAAPQSVTFVYQKNAVNTGGTTTLPSTDSGTTATQTNPGLTPPSTPNEMSDVVTTPASAPVATPELPATGGTMATPSGQHHTELPDTAEPVAASSLTKGKLASVQTVASADVASPSRQAATLPQTGETHNGLLAMLGVALLGMLTVVASQLRRRVH